MTDVRVAVGTSVADAQRARRVRRAGRRCAAVLLACSAVVLGAGPAPAAGPSIPMLTAPSETEQSIPVMAPGTSGPVTVAFKNPSLVNAVNDGRLYMELWAPWATRFTDVSLTPVDGALGGWTCSGDGVVEGRPYESTILRCLSSEKGVVAPAGGIARWRVNMKVYGDAPADRVLPNAGEGGYGAVLIYTRNERSGWGITDLKISSSRSS
ncbi:hypothetical protein [Streptomyces sp. S.PB5]|uniref:hypothetical protein n=1 Tax=Streptomyces sp. S.PB5 TaxID=3020844 RepID=UPI0025B20C21|nr:hypothetical protein [Streptomyces sp. S.PB5]MDN3022780.1 hypothetical protein [Streptomyces sp. S.PB5]